MGMNNCRQDGGFCSDSEVIFEFYVAGEMFRTFIRICAFNTVVMSWRLLKYLMIFPTMRLLWGTIIGAIRDLCWFIVLLSIMLMGYVFMGTQLFGRDVKGFESIPASVVSCFRLFLGAFDYAVLKEGDTL